jgi:cell division protein FtsW (lipid II flippase)
MMRVVEAAPAGRANAGHNRAGAGYGRPARAGGIHTANVEMLGLLACTGVVLLGLLLTYWGRTLRFEPDGPGRGPVVLLNELDGPRALEPLLTMYEQQAERQAAAHALYARLSEAGPIEHVGALAGVAVAAADIRKNPRFVELGARLARRPGVAAVPVLTSADLAGLKPHVAVRTARAFGRQLLAAVACFVGAFWLAHFLRRWRGADDDPVILPALMLLCGVGLMSMVALRDPLRDMMIGSGFALGVAGGLAILLAVSEVDFEASPLRRAVLSPLALAFSLAGLLLLFGSGPGASGAKVNLAGVQPVEAIRLLVILALAAYLAGRLDLLRELSTTRIAASRWLPALRMPRWRDIGPIAVSMALVLLFFVLQKDLGPALVMSCVFLAMYGIARRRVAFVLVGVALIVCGFVAAYAAGVPATVGRRVLIWLDPWSNAVPGGNQIAHGLWALSTGGVRGLGPGLGLPQVIPAGHTDFVLAAVGEELGFVGLAATLGLYVFLGWRALRVALRAPGDYSALLVTGVSLALLVQGLVIAGGLLGLIPLSGVVTPFLSYGKSSMLANFAAMGVVLAIARRRGAVRVHLGQPVRAVGAVLAVAAAAVAVRAAWVQIPRADLYATAASLGVQADGGYRFEYNPRLLAAARQIPRGTIYDRTGLPIATSDRAEMAGLEAAYRQAGLAPASSCEPDSVRCYPLGGAAFHVLGDWPRQTNWGARNSSYLERDRAVRLQGYDDRPQAVSVAHPQGGAGQRLIRRDYSELLPLARNRHRPGARAVAALLARDRSLQATIDARLQLQTALALGRRMESGRVRHGSAVVLDADSGAVLASVSYPWPPAADVKRDRLDADAEAEDADDRLLDRVRYGLYPPGSVFKLVMAGAAVRSGGAGGTFACRRLPDGRVGHHVRGISRPVRDDLLDTTPHGTVDLHRGLVVSCNAYFAQLAVALGPGPILDAASLFQIDASRRPTPAGLRPTLAHAGYGQGEVLVSPLKMARVAASIASGGGVRPLRWETGPAATAEPVRFVSAPAAAQLSRDLRAAVVSGTGRVLAGNSTPIAGKTGTAEVAGGLSHSWFVGFAPYSPSGRRIAFAVLIEHAGYGARAAAPVAGEIVSAAREAGLLR